MSEQPMALLKVGAEENPAYPSVLETALALSQFMQTPSVLQSLGHAHALGASSHDIQDVLLPKATALGFASERNGLFSGYKSSRIRPDYWKPVLGTGILMEVERGKILANNMDLLDVWKCHICQEAHYLFLVLPRERQTGKGRNEAVFERVANRLSAFFVPGNEVNVEAAFLFPY